MCVCVCAQGPKHLVGKATKDVLCACVCVLARLVSRKKERLVYVFDFCSRLPSGRLDALCLCAAGLAAVPFAPVA